MDTVEGGKKRKLTDYEIAGHIICLEDTINQLRTANAKLREEIIKLKTQMLPNELEAGMIEAMDEGQALTKGE